MIGLAAYELQAPLYTRLTGDAALDALVSGVFDHVPEGTAYPYVVIGEYTEIPNDVLTAQGRDVTASISVYDGPQVVAGVKTYSSKRLRQIGDRIVELIDGYAFTVGALGVMRPRFEFGRTLWEEDEDTNERLRLLVLRFRFTLYERT